MHWYIVRGRKTEWFPYPIEDLWTHIQHSVDGVWLEIIQEHGRAIRDKNLLQQLNCMSSKKTESQEIYNIKYCWLQKLRVIAKDRLLMEKRRVEKYENMAIKPETNGCAAKSVLSPIYDIFTHNNYYGLDSMENIFAIIWGLVAPIASPTPVFPISNSIMSKPKIIPFWKLIMKWPNLEMAGLMPQGIMDNIIWLNNILFSSHWKNTETPYLFRMGL